MYHLRTYYSWILGLSFGLYLVGPQGDKWRDCFHLKVLRSERCVWLPLLDTVLRDDWIGNLAARGDIESIQKRVVVIWLNQVQAVQWEAHVCHSIHLFRTILLRPILLRDIHQLFPHAEIVHHVHVEPGRKHIWRPELGSLDGVSSHQFQARQSRQERLRSYVDGPRRERIPPLQHWVSRKCRLGRDEYLFDPGYGRGLLQSAASQPERRPSANRCFSFVCQRLGRKNSVSIAQDS